MKNICCAAMCMVVVLGCSPLQNNTGRMGRYDVPDVEAQWIQHGEPIIFQDKEWYPQDRVDILLDSEVYLKGEYRGVPFFVGKVDVYPYRKIYTKFGRNKFRIFVMRRD